MQIPAGVSFRPSVRSYLRSAQPIVLGIQKTVGNTTPKRHDCKRKLRLRSRRYAKSMR